MRLIEGRKDERELRDFIHAGSMIAKGSKVNQQLAELLGVSVEEVVNLRKKLWRVAGVKELYEGFRNERKADQSTD